MLGEMLDTSKEARRFYYARLAELTAAQRLGMMYAQSRMVRTVAERSIRREYPGICEGELRARLAVRLYGTETAGRVLGPLPKDAR